MKQLLGQQMSDSSIIGGGPVGLIFAILNHSHTKKIHIFEAKKKDFFNQDTRALALSNGSRVILEEIGVWDRLKNNITRIKKIHTSQVGVFGRTLMEAGEFNEESLGYIVSYGDLIQALKDMIESLSNVRISFDTRVTKCVDKEGKLNLSLQTENKIQKFQSEFVILADGATDKIEGLELNKKTKQFDHSAIVTKVLTEFPHKNVAYERFAPEGPIALLPNKKDKFSLVWTGPSKYIDELEKLSDKSFLNHLHGSFGDRVGNFIECDSRATFILKQTYVEVLHSNIVALGNASQTMHPVAGQGLNTGIRDAYKLNKSLIESTHTKTLITLLDEYKHSRASERKKILNFTEMLVKGFSSDLIGLKRARGYALSLLDITKPIKKSFVRKMSYGE
ncbi:MAG: 2-octaprenyl-6-methoxyphenyl hydroxylase [Nitrosomonadales bacterium]|nr:2-octaprenyl-6-methoxyphenyl hydroxylase [Nitrosomonadales bacterium]MBT4571655.1 2-octaprenyl-6-methoxyphenyl hydroxylase [Nitrosomonadales bacterium]MBT5150486.1 2-octaprenyl-6-methoxyphenyl hydroxylase [Nitrosomonadales bacterium]MBT6250603.1 2-octaprenyl-6-methoxyphenyl hydroxylase [Nitrosomonadales bacterium]MBT6817839.1 2-octaprenyl-6-methoxyphenyl hydroxylase [Nitrosomonadales bacterium]